jgi:predicted nucleic acid-binding protein
MGLAYVLISGVAFAEPYLSAHTLMRIIYGVGCIVIVLLFVRSYERQRKQREEADSETIVDIQTDRAAERSRDEEDLRERIRRRKAERKEDGGR